MKPIVAAILMLPLSTSSGQAQDKPAAPKQQYSALMKKYGPASGALRKASTDLERKAAVERLAEFSSKFIDLAEKYPDDPVALMALRQAVQAVGSTDSAAQITWETNRSDFPAGNTDGSAGERSGREAVQVERLSRKRGIALFLERILTDLTDHLAPRAVARDDTERQAVRCDRRQFLGP